MVVDFGASSVTRGLKSLALGALLLLTACSSDDHVSRPTYLPLSSTPPTIGAEQGDPSTTVDNGQHVFVIREVCASDDTPCPALSFGGAIYIQGGWLLNRRAVQALGDELGVSQDGAEARALFSIDTVVAYRSSPEARWQALVASGATHEPANEWLMCSVLATPDPAWITCDGYDLSAAGLTGHWMGAAEQVVDAGCAELPEILRRHGENAVESGSRDEPMFYAVAALIDARWIDLGCEGHLMLP